MLASWWLVVGANSMWEKNIAGWLADKPIKWTEWIQYKSNHKFLLSWQLANTFYSLEKLNWVCNDLPSRKINPSLAGLTNLMYQNLSQSDFGGVSVPEIKGSFRNCIGEVFLMNLEQWPSNPLCHLISQGTIHHSIRGPIHGSLRSLVYLPVLNSSCSDLQIRIPMENLLCAYKGDSYLENVNFCGALVSRICLPNSCEHQHHKLQHFYMLMT